MNTLQPEVTGFDREIGPDGESVMKHRVYIVENAELLALRASDGAAREFAAMKLPPMPTRVMPAIAPVVETAVAPAAPPLAAEFYDYDRPAVPTTQEEYLKGMEAELVKDPGIAAALQDFSQAAPAQEDISVDSARGQVADALRQFVPENQNV